MISCEISSPSIYKHTQLKTGKKEGNIWELCKNNLTYEKETLEIRALTFKFRR